MLNRNTIEKELRDLAPRLADLSPQLPYQVPAGYFESLPGLMLEMVTEKASPVLGDNQLKAYEVPVGYFDTLSEQVLQKVRALETGSVKEELEALSPVLGGLKKSNPFSVPAGYFEELPSNIADGAKAIDLVNEELENLSPVMSSLKTVNVYTVPNSYFEQFPELALKKAKEQEPVKVVSMKFTRRLMQYAVAAAIIGLIIIGALKLINNTPVEVGPENIASIPDTEIQQYLENNGTIIEPVTTSATTEESIDISADDMKEMLADVSDEELQQYVEQTGGTNSITN